VWTPLVEQIPDTMKARNMTEEEVKRDVLLAAQPTKEFVTRRAGGGAALYLCSDAASRSPARTCRSTAAGPRSDEPAVPHIQQSEGEGPRRSARSASTSRFRAAARTARSPGACSTSCSKTDRIEFEGVSGASAGAVNAASGRRTGSRAAGPEARKRLADFWRAASRDGDMSAFRSAVSDRLFSAAADRGDRRCSSGSIPFSRYCRPTTQSAQHQSAARPDRAVRRLRRGARLQPAAVRLRHQRPHRPLRIFPREKLSPPTW
jgi:hypothetical protein